MCIGKARFALVSIAPLLILLLLSSCNKGRASTEAPSVPKEATTIDIPKELSGIWYHSRYEEITTAKEDRFSWGTAKYDYWKALRIDLLGDQAFLGFADATWNNVIAEADGTNKNAIRLHLRQKENPASEEVLIVVEGKGVISFSFGGNVDTAETRMIAGKYYKASEPGDAPVDGK